MTPEVVQDAIQHGLWLTVLIVMVLILPALVAGLAVSMVQAATGIQEMTLSFIPKLIVVLGTLALAGPWLMNTMMEYTRALVESIPYLIGL
jgi:flagellar biosynthetic protein FliQ